jgi:hypothetical protein
MHEDHLIGILSGEKYVRVIFPLLNIFIFLLLISLKPPGPNGRKTFERILQLHPRQKAIIASGFAEDDDPSSIEGDRKLYQEAFLTITE